MPGQFTRLLAPGGTVVRVKPEDEDYYRARGYESVSEEQLRRWKAGDEAIQAGAEGAAAGAIDVTTALPRLGLLGVEELAGAAQSATGISGLAGAVLGAEQVEAEARDVRSNLAGRRVMSNAAGIAAEVTGEGDQGAVERETYLEQRARAEANPGAATAGYVAGTLPFALATPMASSVPGMVAQGAAEGALYGAAASDESAFVRGIDAPATAEQILADGALGAVLGGGISAGMGGLSSVLGRGAAGADDAARAIGRTDDAIGDAYRTTASANLDDVAVALRGAVGQDVHPSLVRGIWDEHIAPALGKGSGWASGAEDDFVRRGLTTGPDGDVVRDVIRRGPEAVIDDARVTMTDAASRYSEAFSEITELSRNMDLKADAVRQLIPAELSDTAVAVSQRRGAEAIQELSSLSEQLAPRLKGSERAYLDEVVSDATRAFRKATGEIDDPNLPQGFRRGLDSDELQFLRDADSFRPESAAWAAQAAESGEDLGKVIVRQDDMALRDGRHRLLAAERAGRKEILTEIVNKRGETVWQGMMPLRRNAVQEVGAADAFVALDAGKRLLQKHVKKLRKDAVRLEQAGRSGAAQTKRVISDALEATQEQTRRLLEDGSVFGDAADKLQARVNAAWTARLDPRSEANRGMRGLFEKLGEDYHSGRSIYRVREDGVESFLRKVGRKEGGQEYADLVRTLDADGVLVDAIGDSVGREAPEFKRFAEAVTQMREAVQGVKTRGGIANQWKMVQDASGLGAGNLGMAGIGYAVGGAPGAALAGMLSNPAAMLRSAAAIQATGRRINERMNGHLGRLFSRFDGRLPMRTQLVPDEVIRSARGAGHNLRRVAVPAALRVFRGRSERSDRDIYEQRAQQIRELSDNAELRRAKLARANATLTIPSVAAQATLQQHRALAFLRSKLPASRPLYGLTPHLHKPAPPPGDVEKFARYYSAVVDPFSALEDLERGRATREQAEALRVCYPGMYQGLRQTVMRRLAVAKDLPPYRVRKQLDSFLDLKGAAEPSMSPAFMARQDARFQATLQQQPPAPGPQGTGQAPSLSDRANPGIMSTLIGEYDGNA